MTRKIGAFPVVSRRVALAWGAAATMHSAFPARAAAGVSAVGRVTPYFKCTEFVRRRTGITTQDMIEHWRHVRAPLLRKVPGLAKFTFNVVDERRTPDSYHGAVEMWFDSAAAYDVLQTGAGAEHLHRLSEDAKQWMHPEFHAMFTRETVIRELPPGAPAPGAKRLGLIGRPPGMEPLEYIAKWRDEHASEVDKQPGLQRYTLNSIAGPRFPSSPWDGYAELSWTDWPAFEAASRRIRQQGDFGSRLAFFHSHRIMLVEEVSLPA